MSATEGGGCEAVCSILGLRCLDYTTLTGQETEQDLREFMRSAIQGEAGAVCVYPKWVSLCRQMLSEEEEGRGGSRMKVATVVNFPLGGDDLKTVAEHTSQAVMEGADEIDLVLNYKALKNSTTGSDEERKKAEDMNLHLVGEVRAAADKAWKEKKSREEEAVVLKVILETGELQTPDLIKNACSIALAGGADFLKTSTGKVPVNATPQAVQLMVQCIVEFEKKRSGGQDSIKSGGGRSRWVGVKVAGGVKTIDDVGLYMAIVENAFGPHGIALDEKVFRIGSSSLLAVLVKSKQMFREKLQQLSTGSAAIGGVVGY
eukprot:GHVS01011752.1.p2 GENE.GHVS01011752.1~~GHVS01011752.1.p2  ORF type:complete len:317 (-),score=73.76 GHVS01011752.1:116-1066(-)